MRKRSLAVLLCLTLSLTLASPVRAGPDKDEGSVYYYQIISVTQTGTNQLTVRVQAEFCPVCKPNTASDYDGYGVGCAAFHHGYPGPPPYSDTHYWCYSESDYVTGRYVALQVRDSGGSVVGSTKLVCDPSIWPLATTIQKDLVLSATLTPGSTVTVEADIFCGWCGHYYPTPVSMFVNYPPDCTKAAPSVATLWPPNHKMVEVSITDVIDPDGGTVAITIVGIYQDEPTEGLGDGDMSPDGDGIGTSSAWLRSERSGTGDGRVYTIYFTATDDEGTSCECTVKVGVPHDKKDTPVEGTVLYDSTVP